MIPPQIVAITKAWYAWEIRGRGWANYLHPVPLEPPFRPFIHARAQAPAVDDGRHHTWLSSLAERLQGKNEALAPPPPEELEPEPEADENSGDSVEEFLVALPSDVSVRRQTLLHWLQAISAVSTRIAFEVVGGGRRVETFIALDTSEAPHVLGQLRAAVPEVIVKTLPESWRLRWEGHGSGFAVAEFGLASEFMVPLAVSKPNDEPLLPVVAALADLEEGEMGLFQVLFEEAHERWAENIAHAVMTPYGEPFFADAPEITTLAKDKLSSPLFAVALRIAAKAETTDRALEIVRRVAGGLAQFGSPRTNELIPLVAEDLDSLSTDLVERKSHRSGMLLSAEELVSLIHFPGAGVRVPELWRARERTKAAPASVLGDGCLLGTNEHATEVHEVRLSADAKTKHVHLVGASGTGKSTLLLRMILEDIEAGHGVGLLDPHGDLVDEVAARIPDSRTQDVVLFDPSNEDAVVGWNILAATSEAERDLLASDLVSVFRRLSTSWGDQMTAVLGNAILVFLESSRGGTLLDLRQFLVDDRFRRETLRSVPDPYVRSFWEIEFPRLIGRRPEAPILTRLDMFLRSKLVRRVVTVREPKLDFRQVTDGGLIFLGKLAQGAIGEENAALLGSLLVSKFHQVTLTREAQAAERRRPFFLYIDEFHHVATASMASLFSGARKYRLGLTVAHQDLYQLHASIPEVERSVLANAHTRVCFRVAEDDARQLAKGFSFFTEEDLMGLGIGEAICRVGGRDSDFNLRTELLEEIDPGAGEQRVDEIRALSAARWATAPTDLDPATATDLPLATHEEPATRHATSKRPETLREEEATPPAAPDVEKAVLDYVTLVARSPFLSVRERNRALGLSAWRGQRLKNEVLADGLAEEALVNPGGRGEQFKLLDLTESGRALLQRFGVVVPAGHGRGGIAHQWWAQKIAGWLGDRGIESKIEDASRGARVDISFTVGTRRVAVEIEMSEGHALENIRKDLSAGFDQVVTLFNEPATADRIRSKLGEVPSQVLVGTLQEYESFLAPFLDSLRSSLRGQNQNRERRRRPPRLQALPPIATGPSSPLLDLGALDTPNAADYLGLSPATLETLRSRGGGPSFVKLGRRVVYRREDLENWLTKSRRDSTSATEPPPTRQT